MLNHESIELFCAGKHYFHRNKCTEEYVTLPDSASYVDTVKSFPYSRHFGMAQYCSLSFISPKRHGVKYVGSKSYGEKETRVHTDHISNILKGNVRYAKIGVYYQVTGQHATKTNEFDLNHAGHAPCLDLLAHSLSQQPSHKQESARVQLLDRHKCCECGEMH